MNIIEKLKRFVIANKANKCLPYINLTEDNQYAGWVNAAGSNGDNLLLKLDLTKEWDQFCLFALASAWSRQRQWENAVYFVKYVREVCNSFGKIDADNLLKHRIPYIEKYQRDIEKCPREGRDTISFGQDLFPSIELLRDNWGKIKQKLKEVGKSGDWKDFVEYLREIKGLAGEGKAMQIKIPLILRELRCQKIFDIPGKLCCVADRRVRTVYEERIGVCLPHNFICASEKIYEDFGDLYDIPAFASGDM